MFSLYIAIVENFLLFWYVFLHDKERVLMEFLKALFLGIIQGITEWLPVSSTGHMLLFDELFTLRVSEQCRELFMVLVQLGSILAVIILYWHLLNPFSPTKSHKEKQQTWNLWIKVLVASIPAGIVGVLFDRQVDKYLYHWQVIVCALFLYGVLYIVLEKKNRENGKIERVRSLSQINYKDAITIGFFQMLALVPGTSRSGSTILGAIIIGLNRQVASQFSFFMAIPVMMGASLVKLLKLGFSLSLFEYLLLAVGFLSAFLVSLLVIKALLNYVRNHDFSVFGWYRIVLSFVVTVFFLVSGR